MAGEILEIPHRTIHQLQQLSVQRHETIPATVQTAVELLYRQRFLDECESAYERVHAEPDEKKQLQSEINAWEIANLEGLKDK